MKKDNLIYQVALNGGWFDTTLENYIKANGIKRIVEIYNSIDNDSYADKKCIGYISPASLTNLKNGNDVILGKYSTDIRNIKVYTEPQVPVNSEAEPTIKAKLPNGVLVSNVYEAYQAGIDEAKKQVPKGYALVSQSLIDAVCTKATDIHGYGKIISNAKAQSVIDEIRAMLEGAMKG